MVPERSDRTCVVLGAGALGLGFLGPELSPTYRIAYVDIPQKGELLDYLRAEGKYVFNQTGPSSQVVEVRGVTAISSDDESAVAGALDRTELVFTAVGEPNLPKVAPALAGAACERGPESPLRILCCENGVDIAQKLTYDIERRLGGALGGRAIVADTVMGRMCRIAPAGEEGLAPVGPQFDWAVAAEPFFGMPVEEKALEGLETPCETFLPVAGPAFHALEDVKMMAHNGLHAVLGFLGALRGREYFYELSGEPDLMRMAHVFLTDEVGRCLLRKHGQALGRNYYLNYASDILRRVTCPGFRDSIARGTRGAMRKLEPWERMVYGVRSVAQQGIQPQVYATGLAAGVIVARRQGETDMSFREVLTRHCGLSEEKEADLIALVQEKLASLSA